MKTIPTGTAYHIPVMATEVIAGLNVKPGAWYIDGTVGGGGHTEIILAKGGRVLGIDQDDDALASTATRLHEAIESGKLILVKANFRHIDEIWQKHKLPKVKGVLLDLGVSSYQLDQPERGFRFDADELDMRMDANLPVTAADLIARLGVADLERLFVDLGEERYARHFARVIGEERQKQAIVSAKQLSELLYRISPPPYRRGPIHPATRVFQALRLAVNAELDSLVEALPRALSVLDEGGRLAVISFHSLEDRIVKRFILDTPGISPITKRPLTANETEISQNPRSRSAKLRIAMKQEK
jgi:16S rRNA (cytosine1402-N4)-methyltransferase